MAAVTRYFSEVFLGFWSLLVGMAVTIRQMVRPAITVQYPHQDLKMHPRFRGHIELIRDETGAPKCVVCMACEKACPSGCISLDGAKPEGAKRKILTSYVLNFTTCSLCGCCVEACKFDAIKFSNKYNQASMRKEDFIFDLLSGGKHAS